MYLTFVFTVVNLNCPPDQTLTQGNSVTFQSQPNGFQSTPLVTYQSLESITQITQISSTEARFTTNAGPGTYPVNATASNGITTATCTFIVTIPGGMYPRDANSRDKSYPPQTPIKCDNKKITKGTSEDKPCRNSKVEICDKNGAQKSLRCSFFTLFFLNVSKS